MKIHTPSHIATLVPYPPGKPIEELEREYGIHDSIKLASNENPCGPSPKALAAISAGLSKLHRYPDGSCYYLTKALAERLGLDSSQLVVANGSNELINLLGLAFVSEGDEVISSHPSFLVYKNVVQSQGGVNRVVPLKSMHHDLPAILEQVNERTRMIFLDNPNNPTGSIFSAEEFDSFLELLAARCAKHGADCPDPIVVLDEAYWDFVEPGQQIDARRYLNGPLPVVALRTFSKAYGLAGLRVGYGMMSAELAGILHKLRQPFNVNQLAQVAALAALNDEEHYRLGLETNRTQMEWLRESLSGLGCRCFPSQANFMVVDVGISSRVVYEKLLLKGVIVRAMHAYGYPEYIRITPGTAAENSRFLRALAVVLAEELSLPAEPGDRSPVVVAIDGPSGGGKSTISRMLAARLGFLYLDTGAMYRAVALQVERKGINPDDEEKLGECLQSTSIELLPATGEDEDVRVLLDDEDISAEIRSPRMGLAASSISAKPIVRKRLGELQRAMGSACPGLVAEGRDMGTVVFPQARYKFYLDAAPEVRARRRLEQLQRRGEAAEYNEILTQIKKRDHDDSSRDLAPLKAADDAMVIDASEMSREEVVAFMLAPIYKGGTDDEQG